MAITIKGNPISLAGHFVKEGCIAPDFTLIRTDLTEFSFKENQGSCFILNIFPNLLKIIARKWKIFQKNLSLQFSEKE